MDCQRVNELLTDYLADFLPSQEATALEVHLAGCPDCQSLLLPEDPKLEALLATDWYATEPAADLVSQVMQKLPTRPRYNWTYLAVALLAWCCYLGLWLAGSVTLLPAIFPRFYMFIMKAKAGFRVALSLARSIGRALSLITPTPLGVGLISLVLATLIYCLYRLEREENQI